MTEQDIHTYFTNFLKRNKYRITPERFEILDAIVSTKDHFDADDLFLRLKNDGSKVSRATVYNTLEILTECSIVARDHFGEKLARYEIIYGSEPHHHVVCQSCGKIEEFVDKRVDRLARDAAKTMEYALDSWVLHIYGLCSECSTKKKTPVQEINNEA
jgi:Fur family transcriptional regulator, ferric uptake regulator